MIYYYYVYLTSVFLVQVYFSFTRLYHHFLQASDLDNVPEEVVAHSSRQELTRKHSDDGEELFQQTVHLV